MYNHLIYRIDRNGQVCNPDLKPYAIIRRPGRGNQVNIPTQAGQRETVLAHNLVAKHFFPTYHPNLHLIRFIDGDKHNTSPQNLTIVPRKGVNTRKPKTDA